MNTAGAPQASDRRAAQFLDAGRPIPATLHVNGKRFVLPPGAVLPARCVKCANSPSDPWLNVTFSWHHPALYILAISPIIYIIVALIVRKQVKVAVPLCEVHRAIRQKRLWIGALCLLGCIPLPMILGTYVRDDSIVGIAILLGIVMFLVGAILLSTAAPLRATFISRDSAEFSGAAEPFLAEIGRLSAQRAG